MFNEDILTVLTCSMKIFLLFSRVQWRYILSSSVKIFLSTLVFNEDIFSLLSCAMKILSLVSLVKWRYHLSSLLFNEDISYRMIVINEDIFSLLSCTMKIFVHWCSLKIFYVFSLVFYEDIKDNLFSRVQWRYVLSSLMFNNEMFSLLSCSIKKRSLYSRVQ